MQPFFTRVLFETKNETINKFNLFLQITKKWAASCCIRGLQVKKLLGYCCLLGFEWAILSVTHTWFPYHVYLRNKFTLNNYTTTQLYTTQRNTTLHTSSSFPLSCPSMIVPVPKKWVYVKQLHYLTRRYATYHLFAFVVTCARWVFHVVPVPKKWVKVDQFLTYAWPDYSDGGLHTSGNSVVVLVCWAEILTSFWKKERANVILCVSQSTQCNVASFGIHGLE